MAVCGDSHGGPNQEVALGVADSLDGDDVTAAVDTNGIDGNTDAPLSARFLTACPNAQDSIVTGIGSVITRAPAIQ